MTDLGTSSRLSNLQIISSLFRKGRAPKLDSKFPDDTGYRTLWLLQGLIDSFVSTEIRAVYCVLSLHAP